MVRCLRLITPSLWMKSIYPSFAKICSYGTRILGRHSVLGYLEEAVELPLNVLDEWADDEFRRDKIAAFLHAQDTGQITNHGSNGTQFRLEAFFFHFYVRVLIIC
jgi:hypothetical protein